MCIIGCHLLALATNQLVGDNIGFKVCNIFSSVLLIFGGTLSLNFESQSLVTIGYQWLSLATDNW